MWLVLDLETTGLDPNRDAILECAFIAVDAQTRRASFLVNQLPRPMMVPFVQNMHVRNGLLDDLMVKPALGSSAELDVALVRSFPEAKPRSIHLVGNSIHFDRAFLNVHCPAFSTLLHHRMVDVTTLLLVANRVGLEVPPADPTKGVPHRAMDDCVSSLFQLHHYLSVLDK